MSFRSVARAKPSVMTSAHVTLDSRASMVVKRQFMSVPPSALRLQKGLAPRLARQ
jgi:hypothetical protein